MGCQNGWKHLGEFLELLFYWFFPEEWKELMLICITAAVSNCGVYVCVS